MRDSTRKGLEEATRRCKDAGHEIDDNGFKYHAARTWLGITKNDDVVLVEMPTVYKDEEPDELHVFVYSTRNSQELLREKEKPSGEKERPARAGKK